ncbi:MAG TPA: hypothetical protein VE861_07615 [Gemmatimonadaceae bacterium]|nr:hypothetical protein [Gemmatimonadaceae bacterium]
MRPLLVLGMLLLCGACQRPDPVARDRVVERDQLRREVRGLRTLEDVAPGKLMDREHEVLVSVSDSLLRQLLTAAFPLTIDIRNDVQATLTGASMTFRSNVARVTITGSVRRMTYPHIAALVNLRGALDGFVVDSLHRLRARINIDDVSLDTPTGAPATLDPVVTEILQSVVERSLPELSAGLPSVTVPVRLDQSMTLPGFGPEGALSIEPSTAPMSVQASRVIAFQNRLWIILRVELGSFATVTPSVTP